MYSCLVISVVVGVIMFIAIVVVSLSLVLSVFRSELSDVMVVDEDVLGRCLPPGMIPEKMGATPLINTPNSLYPKIVTIAAIGSSREVYTKQTRFLRG